MRNTHGCEAGVIGNCNLTILMKVCNCIRYELAIDEDCEKRLNLYAYSFFIKLPESFYFFLFFITTLVII